MTTELLKRAKARYGSRLGATGSEEFMKHLAEVSRAAKLDIELVEQRPQQGKGRTRGRGR